MSELDLYWLAGLLEGEGSFLHGTPSEPERVTISLEMTGEDIVQRAARLLETNYYRRSRKNWKDSYYLRCSTRKSIPIMKVLYPLMGNRRQERIKEILMSRQEWKVPLVVGQSDLKSDGDA